MIAKCGQFEMSGRLQNEPSHDDHFAKFSVVLNLVYRQPLLNRVVIYLSVKILYLVLL